MAFGLWSLAFDLWSLVFGFVENCLSHLVFGFGILALDLSVFGVWCLAVATQIGLFFLLCQSALSISSRILIPTMTPMRTIAMATMKM